MPKKVSSAIGTGLTVGNRKLPKKIPSHKILRTLKYTSWSKINLKSTNKPEFIKEAYSKDRFYTLANSNFIFFKRILLEQSPLKNTKSPITTPKNYDDHLSHLNIESTLPRASGAPIFALVLSTVKKMDILPFSG